MNLPSTIKFASTDLHAAFLALEQGDAREKELSEEIKRICQRLKENAFSGIQISKHLIPKEFVRRYNVRNLWKYNLSGGWRLLYYIKSEDLIVVSVILEWSSHKEYEKRFKYKVR